MDRFRAFLKFAGKGDDKVIAVFATTSAGAARAVLYLRAQVPAIPIWLFACEAPEAATAELCERVRVETDSMTLLVEAQKDLWARSVALSVGTWTGGHLRWPVKFAPFLVPPHRVLILNRHGDFLPGTPRNLAIHARRLGRDHLHAGWQRALDLEHGYRLWIFARVAQRFAPLSRRTFLRRHGGASLDIEIPPSYPGGVQVFHHPDRQWNYAELDDLIHNSRCRWILFLSGEARGSADDLVPLFDDPRTFAVSRQVAYRDWKPCLFPIAPFRQLQPGEAAQTMGPLSDAILVDRAKMAALGMPRTIVPGSAWMLVFWQAAAAGWRSYSVGGSKEVGEFPDWPYEDAEFVNRVLSEPSLRALGPREPALARGAVAFRPDLNRTALRPGRRRVLVVSPYLPYPLSHGGAVRIWNLCRALRHRIDFVLACFREKYDSVDYARLHDVFREVYVVDRDEPSRKEPDLPAQVREYESASLRALIADLCRNGGIDLLQIEFTQMAHFRDAAPHVPAILVEHDLTFTLYRQLAEQHRDPESLREYERWLAYETRWLGRYEKVWTMSAADCAEARAAGALNGRVRVVANGVDLDRFVPVRSPGGAAEVLYIGSFRHRPNIIGFERLAGEIMPHVWSRFPEARLRVVAGPEPQRYWEARRLDPRITLHAFVADVRPLYAQAAVAAVPLSVSAGTNIKVMEAMACGVPVVSTPVGCQGLDLVDGHDVLVRSSSAEFAAALCQLLADPPQAEALATRARATVEKRFDWTAIAETAWQSYEAVLSR